MEKELNIVAILKDKPYNLKLYDVARDINVFYCCQVGDDCEIHCYLEDGGFLAYENNGALPGFPKGMQVLKPSKEMLDWEKFAWKKGDVLTTKTGYLTIVFNYFNTEYASFAGKYSFCSYREEKEDEQWEKEGENSYKTDCFHKVSDEEAEEFIKKVEEHYGGKLNLETLDIKKPEFKDGDIVFVESPFIGIHTKSMIAILNKDTDDGCEFYLALCNKDYDGCTSLRVNPIIFNRMQAKKVRPATDSEKQQLFDALAKEGKRWNPETLQIEDLPKKHELKPFDKVLVRDTKDEVWSPNFFSNYGREGDEYKYGCISGGTLVSYCKYCIPYNDQTAHLLGTTDEWKGGEG